MASIGHVIVGIAASRLEGADTRHARSSRYVSAAAWSLLSLLPDADVVGFSMGVRYGDAWGHRGATHSFAFALAVASGAAMAAPAFGRRRWRTALIAAIVVASHPLLDTLTDGGLGCALLWPFDLTRYFAPFRPIPVAPIGLAFLSPSGLFVSTVEFVLLAPLLWLTRAGAARSAHTTAHRRSTTRLWLTLAWLIPVWSIAACQPARDGIIGVALREDTVWASGFSEERLDTITVGDAPDTVRRTLGAPLRELFFYPATPSPSCFTVQVQEGTIVNAQGREACRARGVVVGGRSDGSPSTLAPPTSECWAYTWSPGRRRYRARGVCFEGGVVVEVLRQWHKEDPEL